MKVFFDTSVLVAASVRDHPHHARSLPSVRRIVEGRDHGLVGAHSLAETYAVLTTLPVSPRIAPGQAGALVLENVAAHFDVVALTAKEYATVVRDCAQRGITGGAIYDVLLLRSAAKAQPDRIYTFNLADFRRLAPDLSDRITAP